MLECWVLRELIRGPCKNSELQVLIKKIFMFHLSFKQDFCTRQMWQTQDISSEVYVEFLCFGGRKVCIKVVSAINKHIYHIYLQIT